jgi:PAS domain S-box-containing protein
MSTKVMADPARDEVLDALAAVVEVIDAGRDRIEAVDKRAGELRAGRSRGVSYAELLTGASGPLVVDIVSELLDGLSDAGSRLRRAEARAAHAEGLSMDKISRLLGVSRQRVSAIINSPFGERRAEPGRDRRRSTGLSLTDPEFAMIAECLPHLVWTATPDGATEYFNRKVTEYTGVPREVSYSSNWSTMVHPEDQERARRGWQRAIEEEAAFVLDCRIRRLDGQFRWHTLRSLPVRGPDGTVMKWIGTATDIDEQKRLEADLRRAEREASDSLSLLDAMYAHAPVGFGLVDEEFRLVRMNQHLAGINGGPLEDQVGSTIAELMPDLWPQFEAALGQVRETGQAVVNRDVRQLPQDGHQRDRRWLASYYPVRLETDMVGIGLVVVEVT